MPVGGIRGAARSGPWAFDAGRLRFEAGRTSEVEGVHGEPRLRRGDADPCSPTPEKARKDRGPFGQSRPLPDLEGGPPQDGSAGRVSSLGRLRAEATRPTAQAVSAPSDGASDLAVGALLGAGCGRRPFRPAWPEP